MNINELNEALCKALGVDLDNHDVTRVLFDVKANEPPKLTVHREVFDESTVDAGALVTTVQRYRLVDERTYQSIQRDEHGAPLDYAAGFKCGKQWAQDAHAVDALSGERDAYLRGVADGQKLERELAQMDPGPLQADIARNKGSAWLKIGDVVKVQCSERAERADWSENKSKLKSVEQIEKEAHGLLRKMGETSGYIDPRPGHVVAVATPSPGPRVADQSDGADWAKLCRPEEPWSRR